MKSLSVALHSEIMVSEAENLINNFIAETNGVVYVVNADGSTFTLEPGCILLGAEFCQRR